MSPADESPSLYTSAVEELVAIAAAIACNADSSFKHHLREALTHGVPRGDIAQAVATARRVKEQIAEQTLRTAGEQLAAARDPGPQPGACCCSGLPPTNR
ncbi:MAG: carboxymuconolactone decarboxylase family protein [Planctomycetaceae bacterium]|nr:carboxymuconolactone decarboxylase family protein [Planctomycetaceae bacterium]